MDPATEPGVSPLSVAPVVIERGFAASPALVCEMWIKAQDLLHWLPPAGHRMLASDGEVEAGGRRRIHLCAPGGADYWLTLVYRDVLPPRRLVFGFQRDTGAETTVGVSFEDAGGGRTRLVFEQQGFATAASRHAEARNWAASLDGLEAYVGHYLADDARRAPAGDSAPRVLTLEHLFDAPRALVFRLWSAPEHVARWWGPRGMYLGHCEMDFREGGRWRFCMRTDSGREHWTHGVYREIRPPERLSFTYVNERDGHEMLVELDFLEEGRQTRLRFRQADFMSVRERDAHRTGWGETFGLVDCYLDLYRTDRLTPSRLGWRRGEVPGVPGDLDPVTPG